VREKTVVDTKSASYFSTSFAAKNKKGTAMIKIK
jgi:hypothetical protein